MRWLQGYLVVKLSCKLQKIATARAYYEFMTLLEQLSAIARSI
jgi:hypothetical protein